MTKRINAYHGSQQYFTEFSLEYAGKAHGLTWGDGIYFADDVSYAKRYAKGNGYLYKVTLEYEESDGSVIEKIVPFLNEQQQIYIVRNPAVITIEEIEGIGRKRRFSLWWLTTISN
ncbi:hypothetical protein H9636_18420 [Ureibacillus sp. Re31]|uniref:ART-PolyVal-like domain-containing protein n=1 Tax=Ureibacillus galli TaxID=2762222 RepID=A0ABR8XHC8_9BACL|nr:hypothetical protein [Ureibacillus galli]MBD8028613.1 hypothetical protein [Ureibacillus galli]